MGRGRDAKKLSLNEKKSDAIKESEGPTDSPTLKCIEKSAFVRNKAHLLNLFAP